MAVQPFKRLTGVKPETFSVMVKARFDNILIKPEVASPTLPAPWTNDDVGSPGFGRASFEADKFHLGAQGAGLQDQGDTLHLVHQPFIGNGTLTARITGLDPSAVAGLTLRETVDHSAKHASVMVHSEGEAQFVTRTGLGREAFQNAFAALLQSESLKDNVRTLNTKLAPQQVGSLVAPETAWVRLTRSGTKVAGYTSSDGVTWQQIGFANLPLTKTVVAGLWVAVQAQDVGVTFESATLGPVAEEPSDPGTESGLPEPWQSVTLGTGTGSSLYAINTATFSLSAEVTGSGPTTHFVHQPVTGDSTLVARVQSLDAIDQVAAAGLMIRQDTSPESAYAFLALTPQGIRFESRRGGSTDVAHVTGPSASAPVWLKLERKGGSIYAYESEDGVNWVIVTTLTIQLSNPVHIGIVANAATSRAEAEFQMLTIASENSPDTPGQIPFTIDTAEIQGAAEILSDIGSVVVGTKTTLPVADGIMHYMVLSGQGNPIGYDVYIPGLKESVVFNASNTVKAVASSYFGIVEFTL